MVVVVFVYCVTYPVLYIDLPLVYLSFMLSEANCICCLAGVRFVVFLPCKAARKMVLLLFSHKQCGGECCIYPPLGHLIPNWQPEPATT